jgi:hypothetical protein
LEDIGFSARLIKEAKYIAATFGEARHDLALDVLWRPASICRRFVAVSRSN